MAAKLVHKDQIAAARLFLQTSLRLQHANILRYTEIARIQGEHYLISELGEYSLLDLIERCHKNNNRLPIDQVVALSS